jgi:hypothetical protein
MINHRIYRINHQIYCRWSVNKNTSRAPECQRRRSRWQHHDGDRAMRLCDAKFTIETQHQPTNLTWGKLKLQSRCRSGVPVVYSRQDRRLQPRGAMAKMVGKLAFLATASSSLRDQKLRLLNLLQIYLQFFSFWSFLKTVLHAGVHSEPITLVPSLT